MLAKTVLYFKFHKESFSGWREENIIVFWTSTPQLQKEDCNWVAGSYLTKANLSLGIYHSHLAISQLLCGRKCSRLQQHMGHPLHPVKRGTETKTQQFQLDKENCRIEESEKALSRIIRKDQCTCSSSCSVRVATTINPCHILSSFLFIIHSKGGRDYIGLPSILGK